MKRTILLLSLLGFIGYTSHAQINEGRIQVGGGFGVTYQKQDAGINQPQYKLLSFYASPSLGRFYKTNRLAGLFLNFGYNEAENFTFNSSVTRTYGGGVFLRQYQPVFNKLYFFLNESGAYSYVSGNTDGFKTHGFVTGASLQTGMAYDITKKMQLELSLNNLVNAFYQKGEGTKVYSISTSLDKDVFSNIGFGFRYYLN